MFFGSPEHLKYLRYKVLSPQRRYGTCSFWGWGGGGWGRRNRGHKFFFRARGYLYTWQIFLKTKTKKDKEENSPKYYPNFAQILPECCLNLPGILVLKKKNWVGGGGGLHSPLLSLVSYTYEILHQCQNDYWLDLKKITGEKYTLNESPICYPTG